MKDCYKNVTIPAGRSGLFHYVIKNHPLKDVQKEVEIVYVELRPLDGLAERYEGEDIKNLVEADKYCVYIKDYDLPTGGAKVRLKYFYEEE